MSHGHAPSPIPTRGPTAAVAARPGRTRTAARLALLIGLTLALGGCGASGSGKTEQAATDATTPTAAKPAGDASASLENLPSGTEKLCGDRPLKIAQVDGIGANSWRRIVQAELADELEACPNVELAYAQAGGDIAKYNTAINSYAAKGFDAIVTFADFGAQALPALRAAYKSGVTVVPYNAVVGGTAGKDITAQIAHGYDGIGQQFGEWLNQTLGGKGKVIMMGGVPGNPGSINVLEETRERAGEGIEWLQDAPVDTNWDPAQYQRVTAGLITKYPAIDAIVSDYGAASVGQLRAYIGAGKPHPPLATFSTSNELACLYQQQKEKWPQFEMIWLDGTTRMVRWAARRALADVNGIELDDPTSFELFRSVDTSAGKEPACEEDLPPDADLSSGLDPQELAAVFE